MGWLAKQFQRKGRTQDGLAVPLLLGALGVHPDLVLAGELFALLSLDGLEDALLLEPARGDLGRLAGERNVANVE
mgnify:FL=1